MKRALLTGDGFGELLTSELGVDRRWHARYPTATFTLCGRETVGVQMGRRYPPTCDLCVTAAATHDLICESIPAHWTTA